MTPASPSGLAGLERPIGFVLGGGGSLGAVQVGMLQALAEVGVHADLAVGCSVGALNGAFVAADPVGAANRLSHVWPTMRSADVFPAGRWDQVRALRRGEDALHPADGLSALIAEHLPTARIEDLALPFAAAVTDVRTAEPLLLRSGPLASALVASAAIPGVFPAVQREGRLLYDGGVVLPVPMRQAVEMGARSLVVLDCGLGGRHPRVPAGLGQVLMWSFDVLMRQQPLHDAPAVAARVPVVYLPVQGSLAVNPMEFDHTPELMHLGYELSRTALSGLVIDGPGLYAGGPQAAYGQVRAPVEGSAPVVER